MRLEQVDDVGVIVLHTKFLSLKLGGAFLDVVSVISIITR